MASLGQIRRGHHVDCGCKSLHAQHPPRVHQYKSYQQAGSPDGKWVSLIVKFGALVFILFVPTQYAIQLQLLGGIWIIQTLPAVLHEPIRVGLTAGHCSSAGLLASSPERPWLMRPT
jgi:hypothetical protein